MQYKYDFHLHDLLVDANQMLVEFKKFYYNRNSHNGSWYGNPNVLPASHLRWCIDSQMEELNKEKSPNYLINLILKCEHDIRTRNNHIPTYHYQNDCFKSHLRWCIDSQIT